MVIEALCLKLSCHYHFCLFIFEFSEDKIIGIIDYLIEIISIRNPNFKFCYFLTFDTSH